MAKAFKGQAGEAFVTEPFLVAFPQLVEPDTGRDMSDGKYKLSCLFPKDNEAALNQLSENALALCRAVWGEDFELSDLDVTPFKDGDENAKYQGYEGSIYIVPKSSQPVTCLGANKSQIAPKEVYAGCLARAYIAPWVYVRGKERCLTFLLQFVQKLEDRPRFGGIGSVDAKDIFGEYKPSKAAVKAAEEAPEDEEEEAPKETPKKAAPKAAGVAKAATKTPPKAGSLLGMM